MIYHTEGRARDVAKACNGVYFPLHDGTWTCVPIPWTGVAFYTDGNGVQQRVEMHVQEVYNSEGQVGGCGRGQFYPHHPDDA